MATSTRKHFSCLRDGGSSCGPDHSFNPMKKLEELAHSSKGPRVFSSFTKVLFGEPISAGRAQRYSQPSWKHETGSSNVSPNLHGSSLAGHGDISSRQSVISRVEALSHIRTKQRHRESIGAASATLTCFTLTLLLLIVVAYATHPTGGASSHAKGLQIPIERSVEA